MAAAAPPSTQSQEQTSKWQDLLHETCQQRGFDQPQWQIMSDRRGGRTAWSSIVTVAGQRVPARFWYDGSYVNNAKEDAAEVALQKLGVTIVPGQSQNQGNGSQGGYYGAVGS